MKKLIVIFYILTLTTTAYAEKLKAYIPPGNTTPMPAVIVCPGGSYCWHDMKTEGYEVAEWLQQNGIAAFVLKYRVQGTMGFLTHARKLFGGHKYPAMLEDAKDALQHVRDSAISWNIDPSKIGIMGFSAGGHLAMMTAEFGKDKPNFVASIYPVVTMQPPYVHKRSRRALLARKRHNQAMRDSLSLELHVPIDCPPVFLINCKDDPIVMYQNSELLDSALCKQKIPHVYIQYQTGGHGFGASETKGNEDCRQWKNLFLNWLNNTINKK